MSARSAWVASFLAAAATLASGCGHHRSAEPSVTVPSVTHYGLEYAYRRLRAAGLTVSVDRFPRRYNERDTIAVGTESPPAGSEVARGSTVTLGGPYLHVLGSPYGFAGKPPAGGMTTVPRVTGLTVYQALERLDHAAVFSDLVSIPALRRSSGRRLFDAYVVRQQSPPAGTRVRWGGILYTTPHGGAADVRESLVRLVLGLR